MAKKIKMNLSASSIQTAIDELEKYKQSIADKNALFVKKLADIGIETVKSTIASIPSEEAGKYNTEVMLNKNGNICGAAISLSGEKVLFIEFSAGVRYGTQYYPLPSGADYGAGTYPTDKHNWSNPWGWWYKDENGEVHHTYGNRAYMPMYHASTALTLMLKSLAREVFG